MKRALVKIVHDEGGAHLVQCTFADIANEPFGVISKRPMVYLADPHEQIEKAMWCYEHGMIPLIAEPQSEISNLMASKYKIDSLITDAISLEKLVPHLKTREEPLMCMSVLGTVFNKGKLKPFARFANQTRLVRLSKSGGVVEEQDL